MIAECLSREEQPKHVNDFAILRAIHINLDQSIQLANVYFMHKIWISCYEKVENFKTPYIFNGILSTYFTFENLTNNLKATQASHGNSKLLFSLYEYMFYSNKNY